MPVIVISNRDGGGGGDVSAWEARIPGDGGQEGRHLAKKGGPGAGLNTLVFLGETKPDLGPEMYPILKKLVDAEWSALAEWPWRQQKVDTAWHSVETPFS